MSVFKDLLGKRINGIFLCDDSWGLVFRTTDGRFYKYATEKDCCNSVWFNHINGVDAVGKGNSFDLLRGALVLSTEDKDWETKDEEDYEVVEDICFTLRTDRGYIDIEVRNSHNGYYGGSVLFQGEVTLSSESDVIQVLDDF